MKIRLKQFLTAICLTVLISGIGAPCLAYEPDSVIKELHSGWYPRPPYQMEVEAGSRMVLTGLEIQLARELSAKAGYSVSFEAMPWSAMMDGLKSGKTDLVMGAYYDKQRKNFAHYSLPYRTETNAVYYHKSLRGAAAIDTMDKLLAFLNKTPMTMATIGPVEDYIYGSERFKNFLKNPPAGFKMISSDGYNQSLMLTVNRRADIFVASPVIADKILANTGFSGQIKKMPVTFPEISVHALFSRKTISPNELETFNSVIKSMRRENRFRSLQLEFLLPTYLAITTDQVWFNMLTFLGIGAFCISGVLLARKERYNFFGALVLATLPAIGGGVVRDLVLGADPVFVLKTPAFILVAIVVVVLGFTGFKIYDLLVGSRLLTQKIGQYTEKNISLVFDKLFKFFDAWAVSAFTVIGVGVALEMQAKPLWLWGPVMGVLTASGGVVLRDVVRADFNIEILKLDSYAEISILGGVLYISALLLLPYKIGLAFIFYLTLSVVALLFALRFFILWKGYENPLQFGARHTHPDVRLEEFAWIEPDLWELLTGYYREDSEQGTRRASRAQLEDLHNRFLYAGASLRNSLDQVAAEPLANHTVKQYRQCNSRLEITTAVENNLYSFLKQPVDGSGDTSSSAPKLQQNIHESLHALIEAAAWAVKSGEAMDFTMLEALTSSHQERFEQLRAAYGNEVRQNEDPALKAVLQTTYKVERIIYLLDDYVRLRLAKKETRAGVSNRKAQQRDLLKH